MAGQLNNSRHELFCRNLSRGMQQLDAYEAAGFVRNGGSASVLARTEHIKNRVSELMDENRIRLAAAINPINPVEISAESPEALGITRIWVLHELRENVRLAREAASFQASNKALELIGRELGMFKESAGKDLVNPHANGNVAALPVEVMNALFKKLELDPNDFGMEATETPDLPAVDDDQAAISSDVMDDKS